MINTSLMSVNGETIKITNTQACTHANQAAVHAALLCLVCGRFCTVSLSLSECEICWSDRACEWNGCIALRGLCCAMMR